MNYFRATHIKTPMVEHVDNGDRMLIQAPALYDPAFLASVMGKPIFHDEVHVGHYVRAWWDGTGLCVDVALHDDVELPESHGVVMLCNNRNIVGGGTWKGQPYDYEQVDRRTQCGAIVPFQSGAFTYDTDAVDDLLRDLEPA